jgi:1,4-dihydroxy-2-naphthoate octaprenyltransferase
MPNLRPWLLAARPKTLSAAVAPVLIGSALAWRAMHALDWRLFAFTLAGAVLIQIGTNLVNDALDFKKGADTAERLGPLRVTQAGLLSANGVLLGASVCFLLAALCGVPLILHAGSPLLAIGLASIIAAYCYTGGPYPIAYNGLGELFVIVFFGLIAVGGTYYVQTGRYDAAAAIAGLAAGSPAVALIAVNNLRDVVSDRASRKRTLAVRLGESFARREIVFFAFLPFALFAALALMLREFTLFATWLAIPLAIALVRRVSRSNGAALNQCLAMAGALQWLMAMLFVSGTVASTWR